MAHEQWLFPGMPVMALLRRRPAALAVLEKFGLDPWWEPDAPIAAVCASRRVDWSRVEADLLSLPSPASHEDWNRSPVYGLLDRLVADHRDLLDEKIPALQDALDAEPLRAGDEGIRYFAKEWPEFVTDLTEHIREEETFLFPRILYYDFCARRHGSPDFAGGSVNVFAAVRLLGNERRQMESLHRFIGAFKRLGETSAPGAGPLRGLLVEFEARMLEHNRLESEVLFPRASILEKSLYDTAISGQHRS